MIIICEFFVHIFNPQKKRERLNKEGSEMESGYRDKCRKIEISIKTLLQTICNRH